MCVSVPFRSGFAALFGRPNVGKSTLLNVLVGTKVAIVSDKPQTTRTQIRGVRSTATHQTVFVDTPGVHRPRTVLGERTNQRAYDALGGIDVSASCSRRTARSAPVTASSPSGHR